MAVIVCASPTWTGTRYIGRVAINGARAEWAKPVNLRQPDLGTVGAEAYQFPSGARDTPGTGHNHLEPEPRDSRSTNQNSEQEDGDAIKRIAPTVSWSTSFGRF
jgi:hypothetical protein